MTKEEVERRDEWEKWRGWEKILSCRYRREEGMRMERRRDEDGEKKGWGWREEGMRMERRRRWRERRDGDGKISARYCESDRDEMLSLLPSPVSWLTLDSTLFLLHHHHLSLPSLFTNSEAGVWERENKKEERGRKLCLWIQSKLKEEGSVRVSHIHHWPKWIEWAKNRTDPQPEWSYIHLFFLSLSLSISFFFFFLLSLTLFHFPWFFFPVRRKWREKEREGREEKEEALEFFLS